jgi:hypothetical protein
VVLSGLVCFLNSDVIFSAAIDVKHNILHQHFQTQPDYVMPVEPLHVSVCFFFTQITCRDLDLKYHHRALSGATCFIASASQTAV